MGFKRKRSSDDSPLSISSFGGFTSTPESLSPTPLPDHGMAMDLDSVSTSANPSRFNFDFGKRSWGLPVTRVESSDMGSRTRKRFRDNRPDEGAVHQKTMHLLFSAQRNASPVPTIAPPAPEPTPLPSKPQKSTLHAFWNLPAPPVTIQPPTPTPTTTFPAPQAQQQQLPHCEDCDAPLQPESGMDMDVDMDVEMNGGSTSGNGKNLFACNDCGKSVCGTCAVVSRTRHCLGCATKGRHSRRWW